MHATQGIKGIFIKHIIALLEIFISFTDVFASVQTIDVVWMHSFVTIK